MGAGHGDVGCLIAEHRDVIRLSGHHGDVVRTGGDHGDIGILGARHGDVDGLGADHGNVGGLRAGHRDVGGLSAHHGGVGDVGRLGAEHRDISGVRADHGHVDISGADHRVVDDSLGADHRDVSGDIGVVSLLLLLDFGFGSGPPLTALLLLSPLVLGAVIAHLAGLPGHIVEAGRAGSHAEGLAAQDLELKRQTGMSLQVAEAVLRSPLLAEAIALLAIGPVGATSVAGVENKGGGVEGVGEVVDGLNGVEEVGDRGVGEVFGVERDVQVDGPSKDFLGGLDIHHGFVDEGFVEKGERINAVVLRLHVHVCALGVSVDRGVEVEHGGRGDGSLLSIDDHGGGLRSDGAVSLAVVGHVGVGVIGHCVEVLKRVGCGWWGEVMCVDDGTWLTLSRDRGLMMQEERSLDPRTESRTPFVFRG